MVSLHDTCLSYEQKLVSYNIAFPVKSPLYVIFCIYLLFASIPLPKEDLPSPNGVITVGHGIIKPQFADKLVARDEFAPTDGGKSVVVRAGLSARVAVMAGVWSDSRA